MSGNSVGLGKRGDLSSLSHAGTADACRLLGITSREDAGQVVVANSSLRSGIQGHCGRLSVLLILNGLLGNHKGPAGSSHTQTRDPRPAHLPQEADAATVYAQTVIL